MPRVAENEPHYTFRLMRVETIEDELGFPIRTETPTDVTWEPRSATTIIGNVLEPPFGAGAWWGYRIGLEGVVAEWLADEVDNFRHMTEILRDPEALEDYLKSREFDPNHSVGDAQDRGNEAHDFLEAMMNGVPWVGPFTPHIESIQRWLEKVLFPQIANGHPKYGAYISHDTEGKVFHTRENYAGSFDLALTWEAGTEITDLKTHKPANGFTKPGQGPAYLKDRVQCLFYRKAWEHMGKGPTCGQRVMVARDNRARDVLEDTREVPDELWLKILELDRILEEVGK